MSSRRYATRVGLAMGVWNLIVVAAYLIWAGWLLLSSPDDGCYDVPFGCVDSPAEQALAYGVWAWVPVLLIGNVMVFIIVGIAATIRRD